MLLYRPKLAFSAEITLSAYFGFRPKLSSLELPLSVSAEILSVAHYMCQSPQQTAEVNLCHSNGIAQMERENLMSEASIL